MYPSLSLRHMSHFHVELLTDRQDDSNVPVCLWNFRRTELVDVDGLQETSRERLLARDSSRETYRGVRRTQQPTTMTTTMATGDDDDDDDDGDSAAGDEVDDDGDDNNDGVDERLLARLLARDFSRETPRERLLRAGGEHNNQPR